MNRAIRDTESCDVRITHLSETYWVRLQGTNSWLYSTTETNTLHIRCRKREDTDVEINGEGTLTLLPGCLAYTGDTRLEASKHMRNNSSSIALEALNLDITNVINHATEDEQVRDKIKQLITKHGNVTRKSDNTRGGIEASMELQRIIEEAKEISSGESVAWRKHISQQTTSLSAIIIAGIAITILIIWAVRKKCTRGAGEPRGRGTPMEYNTSIPLALVIPQRDLACDTSQRERQCNKQGDRN